MDIDGVLLPERARFLPGQRMDTPYLTHRKHAESDWPDARSDGEHKWCPVQRKLDPACVSLLRRLVELSGAEIVASTSWASHPAAGKERIEQALIDAGFDPRPYWHENWQTPKVFNPDRSREISLWLRDNTAHRWVALDDERGLPAPGGLTVSPAHGLDMEAYGAALCLLGAKDPEFIDGHGWPLWTEYGDRDKVQRWLDYAFTAEERFDVEIERIKREEDAGRPAEWSAIREQASRAAGFRFQRAVPRLIRCRDCSPWEETYGPGEF